MHVVGHRDAKRLAVALVAAVIGLLCALSPAKAEFTIYYYQDGRTLNSVADAEALIASTAPVAVQTSSIINIRDANTNSGHFRGDSTVVPLTNQNNYAVFATGTFFVPVAGDHTFNIHSDDGYSLSVDGSVVSSFSNPRPPRDTTDAFIYLDQGYHQLDVVYYERTGRARLEVSMAAGNFTNFASGASSFGLAVGTSPEPSQWALMITGFILTAARLKAVRRAGNRNETMRYSRWAAALTSVMNASVASAQNRSPAVIASSRLARNASLAPGDRVKNRRSP